MQVAPMSRSRGQDASGGLPRRCLLRAQLLGNGTHGIALRVRVSAGDGVLLLASREKCGWPAYRLYR